MKIGGWILERFWWFDDWNLLETWFRWFLESLASYGRQNHDFWIKPVKNTAADPLQANVSFVWLFRTNEASFVRQRAHSRVCGFIRTSFIRAKLIRMKASFACLIRTNEPSFAWLYVHSHEWATFVFLIRISCLVREIWLNLGFCLRFEAREVTLAPFSTFEASISLFSYTRWVLLPFLMFC